jgi:hypothetical protein
MKTIELLQLCKVHDGKYEPGMDYRVYNAGHGDYKVLERGEPARMDWRLIGGFHTMARDCVGLSDGHPYKDFKAGMIMPTSVWTPAHRPVSDEGGYVYDRRTGVWIMIYPASFRDDQLPKVLVSRAFAAPAHSMDKWAQELYLVHGGAIQMTSAMFTSAALRSQSYKNNLDWQEAKIATECEGVSCISDIGCWDMVGVRYCDLEGGNGRLLAGGNSNNASSANAVPGYRYSADSLTHPLTYVGARGASLDVREE